MRKTAEEIKKQYGDDFLADFELPKEQRTPNYFQRIGSNVTKDIDYRTQQLETIKGKNINPILKAYQMGGQGAGFAAGTFESAINELPGVKQAFGAVGKVGGALLQGADWAGKQIAKVPGVKEAVGYEAKQIAPQVEKVAKAYESPYVKDTIGATANYARLGGDIVMAEQGIKTGIKGIKATGKAISGLTEKTGEAIGQKAEAIASGEPAKIMDRVSGLTAKEKIAFKNTSRGKTIGQYLEDTGNFGSPDKIVAKEAEKFSQSYKMVDDGLAKLPGEYQFGQVDDALKILIKKGQKVSTPAVRADYLNRAGQLLSKSKSTGLTMEEINEVKRLFERNVKLAYNKALNPDIVETATNIDSSIRAAQLKKAAELGFENLSEMNRQTQISKFIVNKLGSKVADAGALKNMSLTDWIILSDLEPTSIGALMIKRFFGSKAVQAKIAKMLSSKEAQQMITPRINPNPQYLQNKALPAGQAPGSYPIAPAAPTTYEPQATKILKGSGAATPETALMAEARKLPPEMNQSWYHGTNQLNKGTGDTFYSADKSVAGDYGKVSKATQPAKNPLVVSDKQELADLLGYKKDPFTTLEIDKLAKEYAQSKGYDSILYRSGSLDAPELHVFGKSPVKKP